MTTFAEFRNFAEPERAGWVLTLGFIHAFSERDFAVGSSRKFSASLLAMFFAVGSLQAAQEQDERPLQLPRTAPDQIDPDMKAYLLPSGPVRISEAVRRTLLRGILQQRLQEMLGESGLDLPRMDPDQWLLQQLNSKPEAQASLSDSLACASSL